VVLAYHEPGKNTAFENSIFFNQQEASQREISIITLVCVTSSLFVECAAWLPSVEQHLCEGVDVCS
jgi:hypothetical protein